MEEYTLESNNEQQKNKTHTTILAVVLSIVAIVVFCVLLIPTNDNYNKNDDKNTQKLEVTNLQMSVKYNTVLEEYTISITGLAKNTTAKDYSYASLSFSIYDADGNKLGSAWTNVSDLASGETWKFEATSFEEVRPQRCKLADITVW